MCARSLISRQFNFQLKNCSTTMPTDTSFEVMHKILKRGTPSQMSQYKHSLQLYKLHNSETMSDDWIDLNIQQNFNGRNDKFQAINTARFKVGRNLMVNRLSHLSNMIDYSRLNLSFNSFKIKCKDLFLSC